jgi:ABC-type transporter Mla MlaB component
VVEPHDPPCVHLRGPLSEDVIPPVCAFLDAVGGVPVLVCDIADVVDPDVGAIDALARLQLAARRRGCTIELRHACPEVRALLALTGLADVVPVTPDDDPPALP